MADILNWKFLNWPITGFHSKRNCLKTIVWHFELKSFKLTNHSFPFKKKLLKDYWLTFWTEILNWPITALHLKTLIWNLHYTLKMWLYIIFTTSVWQIKLITQEIYIFDTFFYGNILKQCKTNTNIKKAIKCMCPVKKSVNIVSSSFMPISTFCNQST